MLWDFLVQFWVTDSRPNWGWEIGWIIKGQLMLTVDHFIELEGAHSY